jgi:hypothetical protein
MDPLTDKLVLICKAIDVAIVVNGRHRELSRDFSELFSYVVSTKEKICHYFCLFFGTLFFVNSTRTELLQWSFRKEKKLYRKA